ncbi:biotin--[acetyl-CoA-carboxylase] ligase [Nocardioides sp. Kera G14]|uniref:biotin--[acetyl-CoA-carboxylase] ligase n=1 Tax=Nocardioides sp. Kera G14 TaxID=2884264 RepID=UPI001D0F7F22|nr:biotin--[acetyl-CoA-carboxylase] ligase [Nocardioides sp. Kera G14]UDY22772.1 biotin--[acetyl-CoA-carboxylase] ligase [Nocardioides sp. Kera G14]
MTLATGEDDWVVEILSETPSTNAVLAERARQGAAHGLVIATEHQTAGRGRLDRTWTTPRSTALTFSVLLRPDGLAPTRWTWLPLLTGLAVTSALRSLGYDALVKWPNDVLLRTSEGERKVCGILVERVDTPAFGAGTAAAVIGIGLNTSMGADDLPVETATSLALASGGPVDRTAVLRELLRSLFAHYADWLADPEEAASAYREMSGTLGRQVRAELPGGDVLTGVAQAVDETGCLIISTEAGPVTVAAGDVVHLRAT